MSGVLRCGQIRKAFEDVEGASIAMDIVAVEPDDVIDLGQGCFVRPFLVKHRQAPHVYSRAHLIGMTLGERPETSCRPSHFERRLSFAHSVLALNPSSA